MALSALVDVVRGEADVSHGVTARELLELRPESARWITATALETWLLEIGFAELIDEHELVPTRSRSRSLATYAFSSERDALLPISSNGGCGLRRTAPTTTVIRTIVGDEHRTVRSVHHERIPMRRLLVVSLLLAAVFAPAALANTNTTPKTITVATSSGVTPSRPITVSSTFSPVPRSITIVTSGPISDVRVETSACYGKKHGYAPISRARDDRAGRIAVGYDHTASRCTIRATAEASSAKPGRTIKIAIQVER